MQTFRRQDSYYEEYKRTQHNENQNSNNKKFNMNKLMTDRSSYMAFLEVELERVSSACMTVQAYKERISELGNNYNEMDEKLQQYSRALKLSQGMIDQRDNESNHKFDNIESRLSIIQKKQSEIETDCKIFLNSDMKSIYKEVQNIVKKQLFEMTQKYGNVETRCHEMIHERLDGYDNVYSALERKLETKISRNNEEMREWTKEYMKQYLMTNIEGIQQMNANVKTVQEQLNERIKNLEIQMFTEQPKYIKNFIQQHLEHIMKDNQKKNNIHTERAELTCSKIADDVYKRLQIQRYDLFEHIKNVENRINDQLKETIKYISHKNDKNTNKNKVIKDNNNVNELNSLRNEILNYRSEMLHSQQQLTNLEDTFTLKLKNIQSASKQLESKDDDVYNKNDYQEMNDSDKLVELDEKYSEIQTSIRSLQDIMNEYNPDIPNKRKSRSHTRNTKTRTKRKRKKKKKKKTLLPQSVSLSDTSWTPCKDEKLPFYLTPHLNDLDNLVQCVLTTDEIDKRHSNNKCKKGCVDSNSSPVQKPLWK